ncbi:SpoIIAA family protein [Pontibaca salina]|uniref:STAS/SEC14 domain-containing protein n=1 Tax=Pontibaca salina TaxID=2795731 RepID=A0A934LYD6_9RHOB|nr:STAS/SEC14 domain-containing protein [Pontibaca salina]MBI6629652.1 STAS/SEC14 domain-containing protein [Pontibaca salina]
MPLTYREDDTHKLVELEVHGKITKADYDEVIPKVQAFIDQHGTIRLLEVVEDFSGFEISVLWPGIKFDIQNLKHISHVAVVSDTGWIGALAKAAGSFMSTKLRTFDLSELAEARAWIRKPE